MPEDKTTSRSRGGGPNRSRRGRRGAARPSQNPGQGSANNADSTQPEGSKDDKDEQIKSDEEQQGEGDDSELCHICAESMHKKYWAVAECNHRTCHVCAMRLRALYKKLECTFCKSPQPLVIITTSADKPFETFGPNDAPFKDEKLMIAFETQEMMENSLILLRFNCPDMNCEHIAVGWPELKHHTRSTHGLLLCDVCIRHKKIFAHEHTLYTPQQLGIHLPTARGFGSKHSHATQSKSDIDVHPMCEFCQESFYSGDEHFQHMRQKHEECFLCKADGIRFQQYVAQKDWLLQDRTLTITSSFQNYNSLEKHFITTHHPCPKPDCLAQKFVVFPTEMDLKAHMVERHQEEMSAKDLKDMRRMQVDFAPAVESSSNSSRGRGRGHRPGDRDRTGDRPGQHATDNQRDAPIDSSAQGRRRQAFGGNLTGAGALDPTPGEAMQRQPSPRIPTPSQADADADPLVLQRHEAFLSRLAAATNNNTASVAAIRAAIRTYRSSESSGKDLVDTCFSVLNQDLEATGRFLSSIVDLLDNEEKKEDLLSAWNTYKIEHQPQDLPRLPFGSGSSWGAGNGSAGGVSSGRALQIKRSQAKSGRSQVWDRVEQAARSNSGTSSVPGSASWAARPVAAFPTLPVTSSSTARGPSLAPANATPWSRSAALGASSNQTSNNRPSGATPTQRPPASSAFPSLPPSNIARPPKEFVSGQSAYRALLGPSSGNAWTSAPEEQATPPGTPGEQEQETERAARKKKAAKQTLFTLGSIR